MRDSKNNTQPVFSSQKARRSLFDEYCNYVYAVVMNKLRICGTREDIDECVSDIFIEIYRNIENSGYPSGDLKNFIGMVAKRRAIDAYRKISLRSERNISMDDESFSEPAADVNIIENAEKKERNTILLNKVKELGEPDSTIIIQQFFYNRTAAEIAKNVSMTAAAVQKRSIRARNKLKGMLTEVGITI